MQTILLMSQLKITALLLKNQWTKKHGTIQERFIFFNVSYYFEIIDWGKPIGKEIW